MSPPQSGRTVGDLPAVQYAAQSRKEIVLSRQSFVGEYEIEEREDRESSKSLIELLDNGHIVLGATDGIPTQSGYGQWEYLKDTLVVKIHRQYEGYATDRIFIGDLIALDKIPPTVEGQIKYADVPVTTNEDIQYDPVPHLANPDDAIGYFTAVKITAPSSKKNRDE